jgi:Fe-S oxidoreductase
MHRYYRRRMRPRTAYALGLIATWTRLAQPVVPLANWLGHARVVSPLLKSLAGIAHSREIPLLARTPFLRAFGDAVAPRDADVCIWPDTFSNFFRPQALEAAVAVLARVGRKVMLPRFQACCGRPLYAEGMLDLARRQLSRLMLALEPACERDLPVLCLEPSCAATLKDELPALFPLDPRARYLARRIRTFAAYLAEQEVQCPSLAPGAIAHFHCNQRAVLGVAADQSILAQLFSECSVPEAGCCGMAGPFGFAQDTLAVSRAIGLQALVPAVRAAAPDTILVADGFSCSEQIRQETGRRALHIAEVVARSLGTAPQTGQPA